MRRAAFHGRDLGLPASERLKWKLSSTAGMHLVAAMREDEDEASSWNQVLHSTAWAARNFRHAIARTSSDSRFLQMQAASQDGSVAGLAEMQTRLTGSSTADRIFSAEAADTSSDQRTVSLISTDLDDAPNRYVSGESNTGARTIPLDDRKSAAVRIQAAYRRARRSFIAKREAATKIQAVFRMWLARKQHTELCRTAMQIQRRYRIRRSRRLEKQILSEATLATAIQAHARGFLVRRMVQRWNAAACTIQQSWRRHKLHAELCRAAMQIQRCYRIKRSRRLEKQIFFEATLATAIQAHARVFLVRRMVQRWNAAARTIQQSWRRHKLQLARRSLAAETAATKIQAYYRSSVARKQYLLARKSAIRIQKAYRSWASEQHSLEKRNAACIQIQANVRGFRTRQMLRRWKDAACLIQEHWRNFHRQAVAAKRIQREWRLFKMVCSSTCSEPRIEPPVPYDSHQEDWNSIEVDHLEHCLDTCLAKLHPQVHSEQCGLNLPLSPGCSPTKSTRVLPNQWPSQEELAAYKRDLKERKLQQAARVFLLQHHIAIQQQRAQHAPPFPPWQQQRESRGNNSYSISNNIDRKIIQTQTDYRSSNTEALHQEAQAQGDVILDVQYLLEQVHKLTSNGASSSSVVYMQNDSAIIDIDFTGEKLNATRQHQQLVGFKQMNALLVVFVAVIIYTKSICQGVLVWAKRPAKK